MVTDSNTIKKQNNSNKNKTKQKLKKLHEYIRLRHLWGRHHAKQ